MLKKCQGVQDWIRQNYVNKLLGMVHEHYFEHYSVNYVGNYVGNLLILKFILLKFGYFSCKLSGFKFRNSDINLVMGRESAYCNVLAVCSILIR
jgi:hypothetical protein